MSEHREIENVDTMQFVRQHPLMDLILGHVCHVTTPQNLISIAEDGYIRAETTRNGMLSRHDSAPPSVCMRNEAVSVFDFDVDFDALFPVYKRLADRDVYTYDMHWWNYFTLKKASVTILLEDVVRDSFVREPLSRGGGQFIEGTEVCHRGDISADSFKGFIFARGNLYDQDSLELIEYASSDRERLIEDVTAWVQRDDERVELANSFRIDPDMMTPELAEKLIKALRSAKENHRL